ESIPQVIGIPSDRIEFVNWGNMEQYFSFWQSVDIGVAPLLDTPYNRCRSDIKAVEMSACGVVPILSQALPYQQFLEATGIQACDNFGGIVEKVKFYVENPAKMKEDARRCYDYVVQQRIGSNRRERLELYQRMLGDVHSNFRWPVEVGYHEMKGSAQSQPESV